MHLLRAAERIAQPWKNGGGVTREVAVWPQGAGLDDFLWRVSIAEVASAGPFSRFDGIDRTLAILEGRMALAFEDRAVELDTVSTPFAFPGDVACSGTPIGGAVIDLNVMTRRGWVRASVERTAEGLAGNGKTLVVVPAAAILRAGSYEQALERFDAVLFDAPVGFRLNAMAFVIRMD
jgi:environmental stress-induced protein Ves